MVTILVMTTKDFKFIPQTLEASEDSPMVSTLLSVIEKLTDQLSRQTEQIEALLNEIRELKKLSKKPKLRASTLPKDKDDKKDEPPSAGSGSKRAGSSKHSKNKNLKIDREEFIVIQDVPEGSVRKGYQSYIIQDLIVKSVVT